MYGNERSGVMKSLDELIQEKAQQQRNKILRNKNKREKILADFMGDGEYIKDGNVYREIQGDL